MLPCWLRSLHSAVSPLSLPPDSPTLSSPSPPGPCSYRSEKAGAPGEYRPEFRGGFGRGAAPQ